MGNIIPFSDDIQLPAYLAKARKTNFAAFYTGVNTGFPVLSIKGKSFTLVRGGERLLIPEENGSGDPARRLNIVILNANLNLSKIYYTKGFEEGSAEKPDCYSNDGIRPAADAANIQAKTCAACKHNVWGTGREGRGKACQDSRRLAIAPAKDVNDPMLLRVPPASLKPLAEYASLIERRNLPMEAVVTAISFDPIESTPKLCFKIAGLLDEGTYRNAVSVADSEQVRQIIGVADDAPSAATPPVSNLISDGDVSEALKAAAAPVEEPAPKAEAPKAEAPKAEAPKPKAVKPKTKPKAEPAESDEATEEPDSLVSAMAGILDEYDD